MNESYKVLSYTQPWATLVIIGAKGFETRVWNTSHRGKTGVHASKGFPRWARELCLEEPFASVLAAAGYKNITDLPLGMLLGHVDLNTTYRTEYLINNRQISEQEEAFGDYSPGRFAFQLLNPQRFETPIPVKGALGLWEYQEEVA